MRKLTKLQKVLTAIIETEGGRVLAVRNGTNHLACDYTFDNIHTFTQHAPRGGSVEHRWEKNFRAAVRRTKGGNQVAQTRARGDE